LQFLISKQKNIFSNFGLYGLFVFKMILLLSALCMLLISLADIKPLEASTLQTVRIGLTFRFHEVQSIPITDRSIVLGHNRNGSFTPIITKNTTSGFTVSIPTGHYAKISNSFSSYAEAQMQGIGTILFNGDEYILLSGPFSTAAEAQNLGTVYTPSTQSVLLSADNSPAIIFDTDRFMQVTPVSGSDSIGLGDRRFRGVVEFGRFRGQNITAVNIVPLEQYLFSVVPSEMPASWHMEALRAQAIAARSYTINRSGVHAAEGFDLCDGVHCQVYIGRGNESQRTTYAVNSTAGRFAFFNDQIINATYFSSSGGVTDNSENVWLNPTPYLISVIETAETEFRQWQRTFTMAELTQLANSGANNIGTVQSVTVIHQFNGRVGRLTLNGTSGNRTLQREEIRTFFSGSPDGSLLSRNFYISGTNPPQIGQGQSIAHVGNSPISIQSVSGDLTSALAREVHVLGQEGSTATRSELSVIGQSSAVVYGGQGGSSGQTPNLPETTTHSTGNSVTFIGRGHGHGVGMSQFGARGMAEAGYTYREIIAFYYNGAIIR